MAKRKSPPKGQPPIVAQNPVTAPRPRPGPASVSVGLCGDKPAEIVGGPIVSASSAGESSRLFKKGGDAFAAFCHSKGIDFNQKRPADDWDTLLAEFAEQPIYGCRRGPSGGDHRPTPEALG